MSQVNVNPPGTETTGSGDRTAAAGLNLITVLIVLAVLIILAWFLFSGPLQSAFGGNTNINVNPPAQPYSPPGQNAPNVNPPNVNPPSQPQPQSPPQSQPRPPGQADHTGHGGGR